jgi:hypothetical protein
MKRALLSATLISFDPIIAKVRSVWLSRPTMSINVTAAGATKLSS